MNNELLAIGASNTYETDSNKYLEVRYSDGEIEISAAQLSPVRLSSGEIYDVQGIDKITVKNVSGAPNNVTLQTYDRKKVGSLATDVAITNRPVIQRIEEAIQVEAQATVENGTVHVITSTAISDSDDKAINPNSSGLLIGANPNRKAVLIQVLSDNKTELRIGTSNVSAIRGAYVAGSKAAPAVLPIETTAALYAFNASASTATIAVLEVLK